MIKKAKTRIITIITALVMIFSVGMVSPDVTKAENTFDQNIATNGLNWSAPDLWSSFKISPNRFYEAFRFSSDTSITFQTDLRNASVISISSNV